MKNIRIAIFASGSGSNAEEFFKYFASNKTVDIALLLSNNKDAFALERAKKYGIPTYTFDRDEFYHTAKVEFTLAENKIDFVVLAGFMWKVPTALIALYPNKMVNIHPALLPKFGGKGMYGMHVHQAVVDAGEEESGITIHYVNEQYDEGNIIFQAKCNVDKSDSPEMVAEKVHKLEYLHYPATVEKILARL